MQLTVRNVAELLNVSEKSIYRWINEGGLPAYRISGQYRFNRAELLEWATRNRVNVPPQVLSEPVKESDPLPDLAEALQAGGIFYRIGGRDKESVLRSVVEVLRVPDEVDREFLLQVLLAREALESTGIGDGVAVPHTRNPIVLHVPKPMVTLCFLENPIEFGALDGKPVHVLFTLISPTVRAHLHLLSRLVFALRDSEFKSWIQREGSREVILEVLRRVSQGMKKPGGEGSTGGVE
ncbi:MAG TPA: PTS sugar transporter subunit IIA [Candidatus Paceibacterota bacterium]|nr:PTS sugar transporter subunit IIA [Verrucomicrobiota bacterium]HRY49895.1 PTS sugar transporter subunit IIA [Candidatus Paceibacterota bacterium]